MAEIQTTVVARYEVGFTRGLVLLEPPSEHSTVFRVPVPMSHLKGPGLPEPDGEPRLILEVRRSSRHDADIECYCRTAVFGGGPVISGRGLLAAAGDLSLVEGLIPADKRCVRIYDAWSRRIVIAEPGSPEGAGFEGLPVTLRYCDVPSPVLPTGRPVDSVRTQSGTFSISLVEATVPTVFLFASEVGLGGPDLPEEILANDRAPRVIEEIRQQVAGWIGQAGRTDLPLAVVVAPPMSYLTVSGSPVKAAELDVSARLLEGGAPRPDYTPEAAVATAVAAAIEGTVVSEVAGWNHARLRIGHPSGSMVCEVERDQDGRVRCAAVTLAVRRLDKT